jgi:hypothetical protein
VAKFCYDTPDPDGFSSKGIKDCRDAPKVPNALRALNEALRGVDASAFVLSTIAG